jgi:hypothetical protein
VNHIKIDNVGRVQHALRVCLGRWGTLVWLVHGLDVSRVVLVPVHIGNTSQGYVLRCKTMHVWIVRWHSVVQVCGSSRNVQNLQIDGVRCVMLGCVALGRISHLCVRQITIMHVQCV